MNTAFPFDNTYARLPERFFAPATPTPVRQPQLIRVNTALARHLGLDPDYLASPEGIEVLAGNAVPVNAASIATAYAGHQFGGFVPQLGDGRAILLGEVIDRDGVRRDIQLKGPGRTAFSRGGDGRAAIGPVLREYILSEAMSALGVPTTRALAAVTTGERVFRESMLPGAILTRVASSHIRVGTFQYFAARGDNEALSALADHVIARHYPAAAAAETPVLALLEAVIDAQARLIARWLHIGFIHGVMNTDNMSVAGETIDYGPCAFMDEYNPQMVYSSIDSNGRYAFDQQPAIGHWNLTRLAECLLPLLSVDENVALEMAKEALTRYEPAFARAYESGMRRKIGLSSEHDGDVELFSEFLRGMAASGADFTNSFRALSDAEDAQNDGMLTALFGSMNSAPSWTQRWRQRLLQEDNTKEDRRSLMRSVNPAFIPRNHRVEAVIRAAEDESDFRPFEQLLTVLSRPFDDQPLYSSYANPPQDHERVHRTFCGT